MSAGLIRTSGVPVTAASAIVALSVTTIISVRIARNTPVAVRVSTMSTTPVHPVESITIVVFIIFLVVVIVVVVIVVVGNNDGSRSDRCGNQ